MNWQPKKASEHTSLHVLSTGIWNNVHRAIQPVRVEDGDLKKNYINLNFDNFMITECGDLNDFVGLQHQPHWFSKISLMMLI